MIGFNKLVLNSATVIAALQEYFDKRHVESEFKVTGFTVGPSTNEYTAYVTGVEASE
jgi:hypothetical protein